MGQIREQRRQQGRVWGWETAGGTKERGGLRHLEKTGMKREKMGEWVGGPGGGGRQADQVEVLGSQTDSSLHPGALCPIWGGSPSSCSNLD